MASQTHTQVSPSEALVGFAAWLTCRTQGITVGANYDSAPVAQLVEEFRLSQGWDVPGDAFTDRLKPYPSDTAVGSTPATRESSGDMLRRLGIDGALWAEEYRKTFPVTTPDIGTLLGWFANAIMAGFDEARRRYDPSMSGSTPVKLRPYPYMWLVRQRDGGQTTFRVEQTAAYWDKTNPSQAPHTVIALYASDDTPDADL